MKLRAQSPSFCFFLATLLLLVHTINGFSPLLPPSARPLSRPSTPASGFSKSWLPSTVVDEPTTVIEKKDKVEDIKEDEKVGGEGWEIRLFNDPFNKREFVAKCLSTICGKSDGESYQIMMQAHKNGMGVIGRYMFEVAELYYKSLSESGLLVDMIPVEDE